MRFITNFTPFCVIMLLMFNDEGRYLTKWQYAIPFNYTLITVYSTHILHIHYIRSYI